MRIHALNQKLEKEPSMASRLSIAIRTREHMFKNRLAIIPDLTHYEMGAAPTLPNTVLPFLNGQTGPKNTAEQAQKLRALNPLTA